jgi:hypothetical protein
MRYKLECNVPAWKAVVASLFYVVVTLLTAGIALPYCLFMLGEMLLNHTEVIEKVGVGQAGFRISTQSSEGPE